MKYFLECSHPWGDVNRAKFLENSKVSRNSGRSVEKQRSQDQLLGDRGEKPDTQAFCVTDERVSDAM